jgi:Abortive infection alpha
VPEPDPASDPDARPAPPASIRADALVTQAGMLARWAARTGTGLARRLPGAAAVEAELHHVERSVLGELRRRLDNVDPLADVPAAPAADAPRGNGGGPPKQTEPLRVAMAELLTRSLEQTAQRAREYLYLTVLRQLLPDEARILAALADGSTYPLVHVDCRTGVSSSRRLLANASTVGRAAGVAVPAQVPRYLTRLRQLDLIEIGEPDPALAVQYDICLTDDLVRTAEDTARREGRARIVRQSVRMSALGRELWDACHPRAEEIIATDAPIPEPPAPEPVVTPRAQPATAAVTVPWESPLVTEPDGPHPMNGAHPT